MNSTVLQADKQGRLSKTFWLAVAAAIGIFIVNLAGFIDTITASTEGCGKSWPLCNGTIAPWTWDVHAWIEFGHRFLVFMASVLLVSAAIIGWRKYGSLKRIRVFITIAILGIVAESFLGAMAVFFNSPPELLAFHMGIALLSFASLSALAATIRKLDRPEMIPTYEVSKGLTKFTWFTLIFLYVAIYFGSYVASRGAGGAFRGFPIPTESYSTAGVYFIIDVVHRLFALGLVILFISLIAITYKIRKVRPSLFKTSIAGLVLVFLQGFSGWILILTKLSIYAVLLHVSIISSLFGVMTIFSVSCLKQPKWKGVTEHKNKSKKSQYEDRVPSNI